jgi:hypothetical protein
MRAQASLLMLPRPGSEFLEALDEEDAESGE